MNICEQCGKEHDGSFGSGRFCCRSCSNKWVALHQSDESKKSKVNKGVSNLTKGWKLSKEQNSEIGRRGAVARAESMKIRRKKWLDDCISGLLDPYSGGYNRFKRALIEFGYKLEICECCGNSTWLGSKIPLEVHHKDGDHSNNEISNIQLLCPNCHSLTDNYKWRKVR